MRYRRTLPAALCVLFLVGAGCGGKAKQEQAPSSPPPTQSPTGTSVSPSPVATSSVLPVAEDIPADHSDFGYIAGTIERDGTTFLRFDRAIFLTGDDANKEAAARGWETPVPNDYIIVNDNTKIREQPLAAAVQVFGSCALASCSPDPVPVSLKDFVTFVGDEAGQSVPFRLHYNATGQVDRIEEQYVP
jgi:hypothetical protein